MFWCSNVGRCHQGSFPTPCPEGRCPAAFETTVPAFPALLAWLNTPDVGEVCVCGVGVSSLDDSHPAGLEPDTPDCLLTYRTYRNVWRIGNGAQRQAINVSKYESITKKKGLFYG